MSSSKDITWINEPFWPCLPALPFSWLSILLDVAASVETTNSPPISSVLSRIMSVPRPSIFVLIVRAFFLPAFLIAFTSSSGVFAFTSTWFFFICLEIISLSPTLPVAIRVGLSVFIISFTNLHFSSFVLTR